MSRKNATRNEASRKQEVTFHFVVQLGCELSPLHHLLGHLVGLLFLQPSFVLKLLHLSTHPLFHLGSGFLCFLLKFFLRAGYLSHAAVSNLLNLGSTAFFHLGHLGPEPGNLILGLL